MRAAAEMRTLPSTTMRSMVSDCPAARVGTRANPSPAMTIQKPRVSMPGNPCKSSRAWMVDGFPPASRKRVDFHGLPEGQALLVQEDLNLPLARQRAEDQALGQGVLDVLLNGAPQRTGSVGSIRAGGLDQPAVDIVFQRE